MRNIFFLTFYLFFSLFSLTTQAAEFVTGPVVEIPLNKEKSGMHAGTPITKRITLMRLQLTPEEKQQLQAFTVQPRENSRSIHAPSTIPTYTNLGMNGVPVLDQGIHGACATFATTAGIDAVLNKGDYISQLCLLELGRYLEMTSNGKIRSGWEGTNNLTVLNLLTDYGIVSKTTQKTYGCGGLTTYPIEGLNLGYPMSADEFKSISEDIKDKFQTKSLLTLDERLQWKENADYKARDLLNRTKEALASSNRVLVSYILHPSICRSNGACGRLRMRYDTWMLNREVADAWGKHNSFSTHAILIIGYMDNATVTDNYGERQRGIFILRNSWGPYAGDYGNYYMTYDFFMQHVTNAIAIGPA